MHAPVSCVSSAAEIQQTTALTLQPSWGLHPWPKPRHARPLQGWLRHGAGRVRTLAPSMQLLYPRHGLGVGWPGSADPSAEALRGACDPCSLGVVLHRHHHLRPGSCGPAARVCVCVCAPQSAGRTSCAQASEWQVWRSGAWQQGVQLRLPSHMSQLPGQDLSCPGILVSGHAVHMHVQPPRSKSGRRDVGSPLLPLQSPDNRAQAAQYTLLWKQALARSLEKPGPHLLVLLLHHVLLEQEVLVGHQVVWMRGGPLLLHVMVRWHWAELRW